MIFARARARTHTDPIYGLDERPGADRGGLRHGGRKAASTGATDLRSGEGGGRGSGKLSMQLDSHHLLLTILESKNSCNAQLAYGNLQ